MPIEVIIDNTLISKKCQEFLSSISELEDSSNIKEYSKKLQIIVADLVMEFLSQNPEQVTPMQDRSIGSSMSMPLDTESTQVLGQRTGRPLSREFLDKIKKNQFSK